MCVIILFNIVKTINNIILYASARIDDTIGEDLTFQTISKLSEFEKININLLYDKGPIETIMLYYMLKGKYTPSQWRIYSETRRYRGDKNESSPSDIRSFFLLQFLGTDG